MKSMTAYAQVNKSNGLHTVQLILRSQNYKYLDISIHNLPPENLLLGEKIKKEIKKCITRGKIEVYVFLKRPSASEIRVEEKILAKYVAQVKKLARKYKVKADLDIGDFLKLPQVICFDEKPAGEGNLVLPATKEALRKLQQFKEREGLTIKREMVKNLKALKKNVKQIDSEKIAVHNGENEKEEIDEELSLITFYIESLEKKIDTGKTADKGKAIDFLTQEILRELNTASSKIKNKHFARLIIESKSYLEKIREQAQNVE